MNLVPYEYIVSRQGQPVRMGPFACLQLLFVLQPTPLHAHVHCTISRQGQAVRVARASGSLPAWLPACAAPRAPAAHMSCMHAS